MAEFLTTSGIAYRIERIIDNSNSSLILISPYLKISNNLIERIEGASNRGVNITMIFGKGELKSGEEKRIAKIKNIELYFYKNLHAKCYFNETEMVISSMNLYEYSEKNNREMGVSILKQENEKLFEDAFKEAKSIKDASKSKMIKPPKSKTDENSHRKLKTHKNDSKKKIITGYCIRTGIRIPFNPERPFSDKGYKAWARYGDEDYSENYCHYSGEPSNGDTTYAKPILRKNWKKAKSLIDQLSQN